MILKSKQTIFSILAGIIVGLLVSIFLKPTCWGPAVGVFFAAYLAKVSSPKEGAIIGTIVLLPIGIYAFLQIPAEAIAKTTIGIFGNIIGLIAGLLLAAGIGALYGLIIGKLFQITKEKKILF